MEDNFTNFGEKKMYPRFFENFAEYDDNFTDNFYIKKRLGHRIIFREVFNIVCLKWYF